LSDLDKWKKYHYIDNKDNNCKDDEAIECVRYGELIEKYIIANIDYIALRMLCLYKPILFPLVFLDHVRRVTTNLLKWRKWGFHYFDIYFITCLIIDVKLLFFK